nr:putative cyclin-related protein [Ipomoea batatas]
MGDTHQEKSKGKNKFNGNYALWAPEESNELLQLMVDAIKNGWRDSSGGLSKLTVEKRIFPALNEKLGCQRSYAQYQSILKWFKNRFKNFTELMCYNSGFGWDPITKRFTTSDEVWKNYFKASSGKGCGGRQVNDLFGTRENRMRQHKEIVRQSLAELEQWELQQIPRIENGEANVLSLLT